MAKKSQLVKEKSGAGRGQQGVGQSSTWHRRWSPRNNGAIGDVELLG